MSYNNVSLDEYRHALDASDLEETFAGQIRMRGLPIPEREYRWGERRFRFDFAWPQEMIAVEVEGGIYATDAAVKGHGGASYERNCEKYNLAALAGWTVLRGGPVMVRSGELLNHLVMAFGRTAQEPG